MGLKVIITIAGSDPSSGAGLQMDIKTATKLQTHIATVPTCLTVQNSKEFLAINPLEPLLIEQQLNIILEDIEVDFVKIGLVPNAQIIEKIGSLISQKLANKKIIIDPIIVSTTGKKILDKTAILQFKNVLIKQAYLLTPNIIEASLLSDIKIESLEDAKKAAKILQKMGAKNVLIKGGHLNQDQNLIVHFLLKENGEEIILQNQRIKTDFDVRGTGCMLSSAICCFLAQGQSIEKSIQKADDFVNNSIKSAQKIGQKLIMI